MSTDKNKTETETKSETESTSSVDLFDYIRVVQIPCSNPSKGTSETKPWPCFYFRNKKEMFEVVGKHGKFFSSRTQHNLLCEMFVESHEQCTKKGKDSESLPVAFLLKKPGNKQAIFYEDEPESHLSHSLRLHELSREDTKLLAAMDVVCKLTKKHQKKMDDSGEDDCGEMVDSDDESMDNDDDDHDDEGKVDEDEDNKDNDDVSMQEPPEKKTKTSSESQNNEQAQNSSTSNSCLDGTKNASPGALESQEVEQQKIDVMEETSSAGDNEETIEGSNSDFRHERTDVASETVQEERTSTAIEMDVEETLAESAGPSVSCEDKTHDVSMVNENHNSVSAESTKDGEGSAVAKQAPEVSTEIVEADAGVVDEPRIEVPSVNNKSDANPSQEEQDCTGSGPMDSTSPTDLGQETSTTLEQLVDDSADVNESGGHSSVLQGLETDASKALTGTENELIKDTSSTQSSTCASSEHTGTEVLIADGDRAAVTSVTQESTRLQSYVDAISPDTALAVQSETSENGLIDSENINITKAVSPAASSNDPAKGYCSNLESSKVKDTATVVSHAEDSPLPSGSKNIMSVERSSSAAKHPKPAKPTSLRNGKERVLGSPLTKNLPRRCKKTSSPKTCNPAKRASPRLNVKVANSQLQNKRTPTKKQSTKKPSTKTKAAHDVEMNEKDRVLEFKDVKPILEKIGYTFEKGSFCRPKEGIEVEDGTHRFQCVKAFRKHLALHGVEVEGKDVLDEDEQEMLTSWVRDSIVHHPGENGYYPITEELNHNQAWKLCLQIGFFFANGFYILPGIDPKEQIIEGKTGFSSNGDIFPYLARHGLPENCNFDAISELERLSLELFLADDPSDIFCFENRCRDDASNSEIKLRSSKRRSMGDSSSFSSQSKKKSRQSSRTSCQNGSSSVSKSLLHQARDTQTVEGTELGGQGSRLFSPFAPARIHRKRVSLSPMPAKVTVTPMNSEHTVEENVQSCLEALKIDAPDGSTNLAIPENSCLKESMTEILDFMNSAIEAQSLDSVNEEKSKTLYIYGGPGVGKTSAVQWCFEKMYEWQTHNSNDDSFTPVKVYINCNHIGGSQAGVGVLQRQIQQLSKLNINAKAKKAQSCLEKERKTLFVVIDEIDALIGSSSEGELENLLCLANDETIPIAIIGISNATANDKYEKLQNLGKFSKNISFGRYTKEDLVSILKARVGSLLIKDNVVEIVANKISSRSGDARSAFDMLSRILKQFLKSSPETLLNSKSSEPVVDMKHVMPVFQEENREVPSLVAALAPMGKMLLCAITSLAEGNVTHAKIGALKKFVINCITSEGSEFSDDEFLRTFELLQDQGLVSAKESTAHMAAATMASEHISLAMPLDDVVKALTSEMSKNSLLRSIYKVAKENKGEFVARQ